MSLSPYWVGLGSKGELLASYSSAPPLLHLWLSILNQLQRLRSPSEPSEPLPSLS